MSTRMTSLFSIVLPLWIPATSIFTAIDVCPGAGDRYGDHKCSHGATHRVCAQLLDSYTHQPLSWGDGDFWKITGQEAFKWDDQIRANNGDSWCIDMWATAHLIETVGCENVHLRCGSTDVDYVMQNYNDGGVQLASAHQCLQQKCSRASLAEMPTTNSKTLLRKAAAMETTHTMTKGAGDELMDEEGHDGEEEDMEENGASLEEIIEHLDTDGDKKISLAEGLSYPMDSEGDGEGSAGATRKDKQLFEQIFKESDKTGDGFLDAEEILDAKKALEEVEREENADDEEEDTEEDAGDELMDEEGHDGEEEDMEENGASVEEIIEHVDTDGDKKISLAEGLSYAMDSEGDEEGSAGTTEITHGSITRTGAKKKDKQRFEQIFKRSDKNGDGFLDAEEILDAKKALEEVEREEDM